MDVIRICDLEVFYHVGVPEEERAQPQRLLLDIEFRSDFTRAAAADDLTATIDYFEVTQWLLTFGAKREWKLIETLAREIATTLLKEHRPRSIRVEVKKFIILETRYVSAAVEMEGWAQAH